MHLINVEQGRGTEANPILQQLQEQQKERMEREEELMERTRGTSIYIYILCGVTRAMSW